MRKSSKKHSVDRTRLTWVLAVLVASMTIGTVVLGVLEPSRVLLSKGATHLAATYNTAWASQVARTRIPIDANRWQSIVIHNVGEDLKLNCSGDRASDAVVHFAIPADATATLITTLWAGQKYVPNHRGTIHIGLQLPKGEHVATEAQTNTLIELIWDLQARCVISADRIFVHTDLSDRACGPDPLYPYNWRDFLRQ